MRLSLEAIRAELRDSTTSGVAAWLWVGVAMHDLPLTILAPTDRRDSQLIRLGRRAADRNGGVLDADDVTEVAARTRGEHLVLVRPVRELCLQPIEHLTQLVPSSPGP